MFHSARFWGWSSSYSPSGPGRIFWLRPWPKALAVNRGLASRRNRMNIGRLVQSLDNGLKADDELGMITPWRGSIVGHFASIMLPSPCLIQLFLAGVDASV